MADTPPTPPDQRPDPGPGAPDPGPDEISNLEHGAVPVEHEEHEEGEVSAPRRAASAEFVVDSSVGSEALLREAMDPANQSLAEALRLSFRVLQVVILVLVVLFIFSGFQTVEKGQSGVLLRWGKILERNGTAALDPGLKFSKWPYPAGEFILFRDQNRIVSLGRGYWPDIGSATLQSAIQNATVNKRITPGKDGSVLTSGGDIAHIQLTGTYDVDDPRSFVEAVENDGAGSGRLDADRLVRLAMQRAVVHTAASRSLQEFVDLGEAGKDEIARAAQSLLDDVKSGIRISEVDTPVDPTPALAIKKAYGDLQQARVAASEAIEKARQDAHNRLLAAAGHDYPVIVDLIEQFEQAYEPGEDERSDEVLELINAKLESEQTQGMVTSIIGIARSYRSMIESTLGQETKRFEGLLEPYRDNPTLIAGRLWLDTYARVLSREDTEIFYAPADGGQLRIALAGHEHIRRERRDRRLRRATDEAMYGAMDFENPQIRPASEMPDAGKPGRLLGREGRGGR